MFSELFGSVFGLIVSTAVVWVPIALLIVAWYTWRHYSLVKYISKQEWVLLEVRLPKEINKSPKAMEVILEAMNQGYEGTWYSRFWEGTVRTWFSLEVVSLEGRVHFFIRTISLFKNLVEATIYAQYPDLEIYEVPDYTYSIDYRGDNKDWKLWGMELKLDKPDPYPIKTYTDYGLDKDSLKEEFKVDPMASMIEFLGSLGPGEFCWTQIMIRSTKGRLKAKGFGLEKVTWKDEGKDLMKELKNAGQVEVGGMFKFADRTDVDNEVIKAIGKSIAKTGFDTGIRAIYVAKKENFKLSNQLAMGNTFSQYGTQNLNKFGKAHTTGFEFPWQHWPGNLGLGFTEQDLKRRMFNAYRLRSYFYYPYPKRQFVLNTEELATVYHFPGGVVTTPTLGRIESAKSEPPANLPV